MAPSPETVKTRYWSRLEDGRVRCELCPRHCRLQEGQRGFCLVRACEGGAVVLKAYGLSTGFSADPIEKKPLYHFMPGSRTLSFGTAGCNLACSFCQNWHMSKARRTDIMRQKAAPEEIARIAVLNHCRSVAFTYNEPTVFHEYAVDTARACRRKGVKTVAVSSGYVCEEPRKEFYGLIDAANVDLKSFRDEFYRRYCGGRLQPVLDSLLYLRRSTKVWLEVTTLLIPGLNDSPEEIRELTQWIASELGQEVPLHFSAFHPDWRMTGRPATPAKTLRAAREIGLKNGLRYVYTGNVRDVEGSTTYCHRCGAELISRTGFTMSASHLGDQGRCLSCNTPCAGIFRA